MTTTAEAVFSDKSIKFKYGYVGSDEITLVKEPLTDEQLKRGAATEYNGRTSKLLSLLAGQTSVLFAQYLQGIYLHTNCLILMLEFSKSILKNWPWRIFNTVAQASLKMLV